ncbi:nucleotidyltransferase family protein [Neomicrococcus aestuarii]|uniref:2-nitropropane dioxygenase n=1 Tax=Neomicrococcus aestuarii TaxID=556325 RepID=A0A1L2ZML6_9MICC|nr:nucleotidyltransferase family protein [Neomicrococcus aestuarii]APF40457.1 hypothetical protein BHE16_04845 [Neomicrococcus aestuarii]
MAEREKDIVPLPLEVRVRMTHALIAVICRENGIDVLHIKGHSAPDGFYRPNRTSSDADILVRPTQAKLLVSLLTANGWKTVTTFESGSIFQHATALWHTVWGYVDIHRSFPGISIHPDEAFQEFWSRRSSKSIAQQQCNVPDSVDHALLIAIHAARDPSRGNSDVEYLKLRLEDEWQKVVARSTEMRAETPFAIATQRTLPANVESSRDFLLWRALANGDDRLALLQGRLAAANGMFPKAKILASIFIANRDHLHMQLQRPPRWSDYVLEFKSRANETLSAWKKHRKGRGE